MNERVKAITAFLKTATLPTEATTNGHEIQDVPKFVATHLRYINAKPMVPYLERLEELRTEIEKQ